MPSVYSVSSLCQINFQGFKETWDRQAGWRLERCDGDQKSDCRRPPSVAVIWWSDSLTRARPAYKVVMLTKSPWRNEEPDVGDCLISSYVKMDLVSSSLMYEDVPCS